MSSESPIVVIYLKSWAYHKPSEDRLTRHVQSLQGSCAAIIAILRGAAIAH